MIEFGGDPRYNNDAPLLAACECFGGQMAILLIEEYGADINVLNYSQKISTSLLKYLLEKELAIGCSDGIRKILVQIHINRDSFDYPKQIIIDSVQKAGVLDKNVLEMMLTRLIIVQPEWWAQKLIVDDIYIFKNAGLDNYDGVFSYACVYCNTDVILYMINMCAADIDTLNGEPLKKVLLDSNLVVLKILLDAGAKILDCHIEAAIKFPKTIPILIEYGVTEERIARIYAMKIFTNNIAKVLVDGGVDFNQIIQGIKYD